MKLHTVFLATVPPGASTSFEPSLESEHVEVKWMDLQEAAALPVSQLHPVLAEVLSPAHRPEVAAAFGVNL